MAQKRKRNKKWISWAIILLLFVVAATMIYLVWDSYFNDKNEELGDETVEVIDDNTNKEELKDQDEVVNNEEDDEKVKQYDGEDPNKAEELSGSITYASKIDDRITIRLNIDQYLNEGECELHLINNGADVYSDTTNITGSASTATCEGFDISANNIGSGKYEIVVNISSGAKKGIIRGEMSV
ncbi:hypothetical protein IKG33_03530 [Candidatus Saccharibacteria bacterium]|nr:hypothetical protein [Candidatus Saccharibacteria bacterium]MBR3132444.1 hypothetical protein [Candidatus Saccharibacteria bacterium]